MITGIDGVIGRAQAPEKAGVADNTIIIFSGDNGYYERQRGFAGKWSHYEESLRVPLIIYDPRADKNRRARSPSRWRLTPTLPRPSLAMLA